MRGGNPRERCPTNRVAAERVALLLLCDSVAAQEQNDAVPGHAALHERGQR